jgi:hypothetical protein
MLEDNKKPDAASASLSTSPLGTYKVGPGRPPKEHQFKRGQSGNPLGAKRKKPSMDLDLKLALERALTNPVTLKQGERERTVTMAQAGIEQLVAQFAKGDKNARRDLVALAGKLGVDLVAGAKKALVDALAPQHEAILRHYVDRQYDKYREPTPVIAPPELRDDDSGDNDDKKGN